jgi:hypothetical protein
MNKQLLGRRFAPDARDKQYPLRALLPIEPPVPVKYWDDDYWTGDQGNTSQCVGYAWAHWIENDPIVYSAAGPEVNPVDIYIEAQKVDEWPGQDYEGTSVRAGAKVLASRGNIQSYHWAVSAQDVADTILSIGPVVVGSDWTEDMFNPNANGVIAPTGPVAGGHAYLINGYDSNTKMFRIKNSWGKSWGKDGHAFISQVDLNSLLAADGEGCLALEAYVDSPTPPETNWFMALIQKIIAFFKELFS